MVGKCMLAAINASKIEKAKVHNYEYAIMG